MDKLLRVFLIGAMLAAGGATVVQAAAADPIDGVWTLNVAKSKYDPGPAPQSLTRTYTTSGDEVSFTVSGIGADGKPITGKSTYKYDGNDYPIAGSPDFDVIAVKRVDKYTVKSVQKRGGKPVGTSTRKVSKDGKRMTLSSKGTSVTSSSYNIVQVFDRQ